MPLNMSINTDEAAVLNIRLTFKKPPTREFRNQLVEILCELEDEGANVDVATLTYRGPIRVDLTEEL